VFKVCYSGEVQGGCRRKESVGAKDGPLLLSQGGVQATNRLTKAWSCGEAPEVMKKSTSSTTMESQRNSVSTKG
jgi:hypothetical protein